MSPRNPFLFVSLLAQEFRYTENEYSKLGKTQVTFTKKGNLLPRGRRGSGFPDLSQLMAVAKRVF